MHRKAQKNKIQNYNKNEVEVEVEGKKESARDFWPKQFWLQFFFFQKIKKKNK